MLCETHKSLLRLNTFGIEACARVFIRYDTERELEQAIRLCGTEYAGMPTLHIGGGSNLLFVGDFHGVVLLSAVKGVEVLSEDDCEVTLKVGAGETHDRWVQYAVSHGWHGLENLSLIPGQVGASAVQNIGAYGVEASDVISSVEGIGLDTGEKRVWDVEDCGYGYRTSVFKNALKGKYAITHVTYRLAKTYVPRLGYGGLETALHKCGLEADTVSAQEVRDLVSEIRREKLPDPAVTGNAGSFFMNPVVDNSLCDKLLARYPSMPHFNVDTAHSKIPAGWLIEQCGWKGRSLGKAGVHPRQALVLVNKGGATGADILALSKAISEDVGERFGISLTPEVNIVMSSPHNGT